MKKTLKKTIATLLLAALAICAFSLGALADGGELTEIEGNPTVELFYVLTGEGKPSADAEIQAELDTPATGDASPLPLLAAGLLLSLSAATLLPAKREH